jgi:hypothetical protein
MMMAPETAYDANATIVVTGSSVSRAAMVAQEEQLGDLKLYRVPEPVTVAAKGLKQIAFLQKDEVEGDLVYEIDCEPGRFDEGFRPAARLLETVNDEEHGLGVALPSGGVAVFEPSSYGPLLVGEERLRDYASGQDVEIALGTSDHVQAMCRWLNEDDEDDDDQRMWIEMEATVANALRVPVRLRLNLGWPADWEVARRRGLQVKDGQHVVEVRIPATSERTIDWRQRRTTG